MCVVFTMVGPVFRVALRYPVGGGLNDGFQGLAGATLGHSQPRLSVLKASSMGLKSGGKYSRRAP